MGYSVNKFSNDNQERYFSKSQLTNDFLLENKIKATLKEAKESLKDLPCEVIETGGKFTKHIKVYKTADLIAKFGQINAREYYSLKREECLKILKKQPNNDKAKWWSIFYYYKSKGKRSSVAYELACIKSSEGGDINARNN